MRYKNSLVTPSDKRIRKFEEFYEMRFPKDYIAFIKQCNGCIPIDCTFVCGGHEYLIERFLCMLDDDMLNEIDEGCFDIGVVIASVDDRLSDDGNSTGLKLIPIADLFAGELVCLDFRKDMDHPEVCIWFHEESEYLSPSTQKVANSFTEFLSMLKEPEED